MKDLTQEMLVKDIAEHTGRTREEVREVLHQLDKTLLHTAKHGTYDGIRITSSLHIAFRKQAARTFKLPGSSEKRTSPARVVGKMRSTQQLTSALNDRLSRAR